MATEPVKSLPNPAANPLPIRAVTVFGSGVSYFERTGTMPPGNVSVPLTFRTEQVSDLLKSLVLLDVEGSVAPVVYPSQDPLTRTLQTFSVDVSSNQSRGEMLQSLRGSEIRLQTFAGETLEGRILSVEERLERTGRDGETMTIEVLSLVGSDGVVAVDLSSVRTFKLLDERLDKELRDALVTLASRTDEAKRTLTLGFQGKKSRPVRVGYLTESPIWKVSYRLVLADPDGTSDEPGKTTAYLQGWAIVENTTSEDWNDVTLTLVSGRPSSFVQDLYTPRYVARPVVQMEEGTTLAPLVHGGTIDFMEADEGYGGGMPVVAAAAPMPAPGGAFAMKKEMARSRGGISADRMATQKPAATGASAGELFAYTIGTPVSLPRNQAAMLPVVSDGGLPVEKLSLYNPHNSDRRFPWNAVRVSNKTDLHLKAGPVTLFDGGSYAGEARIEDVAPGDERLLTYALDTQIEAESTQGGYAMQAARRMTISGGVLQVTRAQRSTTTYRVTSKAKEARRILVEHPIVSNWILVDTPEPAERTGSFYRFALDVAPGKSQSLKVITEQAYGESFHIWESDTDVFVEFIDSETVPVRIKNALRPVVEVRRRLAELESEIEEREEEIETLHTEQARLRENLSAVEKNTPLYRRFLTDLEAKEDRLAVLAGEIKGFQESERVEKARLRDYVAGLSLT